MSTPEIAKRVAPAGYQRVYVWELPVRVFHWINALAIVLLCATGYLIGAPMRMFYAAEAYQQYWFGTVRCIHFVAAFVFVFNLLFRVYWSLVGNRYSRWRSYLPLTRPQRREFVEILRADVLQTKLHGPVSTGHNAVAALVYLGLLVVAVVQIVTGFALYSSMSRAWLPARFHCVVTLAGSEFGVRFVHHLMMWFFLLFIIVHVYLAFYHDYIEGRGTVSSIIGGWKFERRKDE